MAVHDSIAPFVGDRDSFGHWLSGFTDGEGYFGLAMGRPWGHYRSIPRADFAITLRKDDEETLRQIRSYLRCGFVRDKPRSPHANWHPAVTFQVGKLRHLATSVIPHFVAYPLRAKKRKDFEIWRQAVAMCWCIQQRKWTGNGAYGMLRKWTEAEIKSFLELKQRLLNQRSYEPIPADLPSVSAPEKSLFD